jgi:hypothetical protein
MSQGRIAERVAAMPRCTAMSKQKRRRCQRPASPGYPVCYWHGAHRNGGPRDNINAMIHGDWSREEIAALKAGRRLGRAVRGVARNALARIRGLVPDDEGAAESKRLWGAIAEAQATQKLAREEKAARRARKRSKSRSSP